MAEKIRLETLLLKSGMRKGEICHRAGVAPRMLYELRTRKYQKPPTTKSVGKIAKVLGVTKAELMRMVCANSPAGRTLAAQDAAVAASGSGS